MNIVILLILCVFGSQNIFSQTNAEAPLVETNEADVTPKITKQQSKPSSTPSAQSTVTNTNSTNSPEDHEEAVPYPQTHKAEKTKKAHLSGPPSHYGACEGSFWIGQRVVTPRHAGWGWLKREGENWKTAKWIMLKEEPGKIQAPHRFHDSASADDNMQYRFYGEFAPYKGYEPNIDTLVDVFILKGFEVVGPGEKIQRSPPGPSGSGAGRISERDPIKLRGS